jgi:hypothetical protein
MFIYDWFVVNCKAGPQIQNQYYIYQVTMNDKIYKTYVDKSLFALMLKIINIFYIYMINKNVYDKKAKHKLTTKLLFPLLSHHFSLT